MKQRLLLSIIACGLALAMPLQAATSYGISIGGVAVTSSNAYNITGNGISTTATGKISYNASTNTLTLNGAYVDCQNHNGISIQSSATHGLRIVLEDDNYFYNINGVAMAVYHPTNATYSSPNVYIQGTGTLTFPKGQGDITTANQAYLCIGNGVQGGAGGGGCTINADAIYSMKDGQGNRGGYLAVTDACVNLRGFSYGTVYGFTWVYNSGTDLAYLPEGAYYNTSSSTGDYYYLADSTGKKITGEVKMGWRRYGLTVGGVDVHAKNYTNIKGLAISGTVSYSPSSKQLNLNNATIDIRTRLDWSECIVNYGDDLKVNVTGTCTITRGNTSQGQDDRPTISSAKNLTFQGSGSLTIDNYQARAIKMGTGGQTLTFSKVENFNVKGTGLDMGGGTLSVDNASLTVYDIGSLGDLKMTDTEFVNTRLIWDPDKKSIRYHYSNNRPVYIQFKKVTEKYGVYIVGHELNDVNASNFYYYNTSGTLTATKSGSTVLDIEAKNFQGDGLNKYNLLQVRSNCPFESVCIVQEEGDSCVLKNPNGVGAYSYKHLYLNGGKTVIDGAIYTYDEGSLRAYDATLEAKDIAARDNNGFLRFCNTTVHLSGNGYGYATIRGYDYIDGDAVFVSSDMNTLDTSMAYDSDARVLRKDGSTYTGAVHMMTPRSLLLHVNEEPLNVLNADDFLFDELKAGRVSFDEQTATLTLEDVVADFLEISDRSNRDTLYIQLKGQTKLTGGLLLETSEARSDNPLAMVVVRGDNPDSRSSIACGYIRCETSLRLQDCQVEASRLFYKMPSYISINTSELVVDNAHVSLEGNADPTVFTLGGFRTFSMQNAHMATPTDWRYFDDAYKIWDYCVINHEYANMPVEIVPDNVQLKGDVNDDNVVDVADIATIISVMASGSSLPSYAMADVNGDGVVDVADIATVISIMAANARMANVVD